MTHHLVNKLQFKNLNLISNYCRFFKKEKGGVVAIEFALIFPLLIILLSGVVETFNYLTISRKVAAAVEVTGDLIGVEITMSLDQINNIFAAAETIIAPFDVNNLELGAASLEFNDESIVVGGWAEQNNGAAFNFEDTPGFEDFIGGGLSANTSVIIVRASWTYVPIFIGNVIPFSPTITDHTYTRPRRVEQIPFIGIGGGF